MDPIFLKSFYIAGFSYYQGVYVFDQLKIGTLLELVPDEKNTHDDFAVEIRFKDKKLGYIPRNENKEIAIVMKAGYRIFQCIVQQVNPNAHPEEQVRVAVYVLPTEQ